MLRRPAYALSIKQPWAALLVAGRKTVEVRRWPTQIRGPVYIHAARLIDQRPAGWILLPTDLMSLARLTGGLIGTAELSSCVVYRTPDGFARDVVRHLNDPAWFALPRMYGFTFRAAQPVPFVPCKGSVRFFKVGIPEGK